MTKKLVDWVLTKKSTTKCNNSNFSEYWGYQEYTILKLTRLLNEENLSIQQKIKIFIYGTFIKDFLSYAKDQSQILENQGNNIIKHESNNLLDGVYNQLEGVLRSFFANNFEKIKLCLNCNYKTINPIQNNSDEDAQNYFLNNCYVNKITLKEAKNNLKIVKDNMRISNIEIFEFWKIQIASEDFEHKSSKQLVDDVVYCLTEIESTNISGELSFDTGYEPYPGIV